MSEVLSRTVYIDRNRHVGLAEATGVVFIAQRAGTTPPLVGGRVGLLFAGIVDQGVAQRFVNSVDVIQLYSIFSPQE